MPRIGKTFWSVLVAAGLMVPGGPFAVAQETPQLKIGFVATLSGPAAIYGQHMHDGFMLGVMHSSGALGGLSTKVFVVDDKLDGDHALTEVTRLIEENDIDVLTGVNFSRVMHAIHDPVVRSKTLFIGTHSGPAPVAGRECNRYFFSTAAQDDQVHETMGRYASLKGFQSAVTIAPDFEAGRDAVAAFKRHFKGNVAQEFYTELGRTDFSSELEQLHDMDADAIFAFMPGGMGVKLVSQFHGSGLKGLVPFLTTRTVDAVTLPFTQSFAEGVYSAASWAPNLENPVNKRFVRDFERQYGYVPSSYAAQAYDAARLIHFALEMTGGIKEREALVSAIASAPFESVRGEFKFNSNHFPIQDFYLLEGVRRTSSRYEVEAVVRVFDNFGDTYAGSCRL